MSSKLQDIQTEITLGKRIKDIAQEFQVSPAYVCKVKREMIDKTGSNLDKPKRKTRPTTSNERRISKINALGKEIYKLGKADIINNSEKIDFIFPQIIPDVTTQQNNFLKELEKSGGIFYPALKNAQVSLLTVLKWKKENRVFAECINLILFYQTDLLSSYTLKGAQEGDYRATALFLKIQELRGDYKVLNPSLNNFEDSESQININIIE